MFPHIKLLNSEPTELEDITSFNGRTGPVVPHEDDYKLYYAPSSNTVILVQIPQDFGTIDSSKVYVIDGVIDMTGSGIQLEIPAGGLSIAGYTFDVSKIICSDTSYTLLTSPVGGSGNLLTKDVSFEITGTSSQLFDIKSATGFDAFEIIRTNFNDCTSLGTIDNYRQGFESGTGRFGGTPNLILKGVWVGGYFIDSSIVRSLDAGFSGSLYEVGAGFSMLSRFRSNQNIDLPASASFFDFAPSNFPNSSTVQITGAIVTRNGVIDPSDANITPNMDHTDLSSSWTNNFGMTNTFVGGRQSVTTEVTTTISVVSTPVILAAVWATTDLQHFDSPAAGQLRHLGATPIDYKVTTNFIIDGPQNDDIELRVVKWDDSASTNVTVNVFPRQVNAFTGSRDVAFFNLVSDIVLDTNDYVFYEVANNSGTGNLTVELDGTCSIEMR